MHIHCRHDETCHPIIPECEGGRPKAIDPDLAVGIEESLTDCGWFLRQDWSVYLLHGTERVMPTEGKNSLQPMLAVSAVAVLTGVAVVFASATSLLETAIEEFSDSTRSSASALATFVSLDLLAT